MPGIDIIPTHVPIPNMGFLPVNAFVVKAKEPVLIDTGIAIESDEFMNSLESVIDPKDLKWIWLTHDDLDHTGSIRRVVEAAPNAKLLSNALSVLRLNTVWSVPMDRIYWMNSGGRLDLGDRIFHSLRPPLFDNPMTIGVYDEKSEVFFSADFFGGIMPSPSKNADEIEENMLHQGMSIWATADSPWVHIVDRIEFGRALDNIRKMAPKMILSTHLPPAKGRTEQFLDLLSTVPALAPFVAPDQMALEQLLIQMKAGN